MIETPAARRVRYCLGIVGAIVLGWPFLAVQLPFFVPWLIPAWVLYLTPMKQLLLWFLTWDAWGYLATLLALGLWFHLSFGAVPSLLYKKACQCDFDKKVRCTI